MTMTKRAALCVLLLLAPVAAFNAVMSASPPAALASLGRRAFGQACAASLVAGTAAVAAPTTAAAAGEGTVDVYFGVGCFWHVQHEFIEAERRILQRTDDQLTALAGYAGGTKTGRDTNRPGNSLVCYHNLQGVADYGRLGHGEVVGLSVPPNSVGAFAEQYFALFDKNGDRPDRGDRGLEYRSLVGLPGGAAGPLFEAVKAVADTKGIALTSGSGNDGDTLGKKLVWVYDTAKFPFYQAEVYHQYHDGFMPGEDYPKSYNELNIKNFKAGRVASTGCPDIV